MPSEHRLHAYSVVFAFLTQIRHFVVPGILVAAGASSRADDWWAWQPWMMLFIIPNAIVAVVRYLTYAYVYGERELIIRSGLLFRRERHIPYARIQNIDAIQNPLHRLLNVVDVKIETGGGEASEATMSVLPTTAFQEMRQRVFADRHAIEDSVEPGPAPAAAQPLLSLSVRELLLCGFIENRGAVLASAAFGLVWEFGLFDRMTERVFGEQTVGRGLIRNLARSLYSSVTVSWSRIALTLAAFVAFLLLLRLISMVWAVVRLYGFTLTLADDDARCEYGLLTRVAATIPLRRIQLLTVREGPLHRYFGRVAVRVDTAGGHERDQQKQADREFVAPILRKSALPAFVRSMTGIDLNDVTWQAPHPRAFRREVKPWIAMALAVWIGLQLYVGWASLVAVPPLLLWAIVGARQYVKHLRWAETGEAVLLANGWLWRRTVVVRFAKMQVVTLHESPFDRSHTMATVHVDTAGASRIIDVRVPYLARPAAEALHARLAGAAASTQFKW